MTQQRLPKVIDPLRMAKEKIKYQGSLFLEQMSRLHDIILPPRGEVKVRLHGFVDALDYPVIEGSFATELSMTCQRCLQPFAVPVTGSFLWSPVNSDEAARELPDTHDAILYQGAPLVLHELIEDEILLGLPVHPVHSKKECRVDKNYWALHNQQQTEESKELTHRPFAGLANLKGLKKDS